MKDEEIEKTMQVNTFAHFWTVKAFLPSMLKNNHGHIVTVASVLGMSSFNKHSETSIFSPFVSYYVFNIIYRFICCSRNERLCCKQTCISWIQQCHYFGYMQIRKNWRQNYCNMPISHHNWSVYVSQVITMTHIRRIGNL